MPAIFVNLKKTRHHGNDLQSKTNLLPNKKNVDLGWFKPAYAQKILQSHLKEDFLQRRARSPNYLWSLVPLFLSSLIQVKAVNFAAGDKVGEGDIMVEIEHHPDH